MFWSMPWPEYSFQRSMGRRTNLKTRGGFPLTYSSWMVEYRLICTGQLRPRVHVVRSPLLSRRPGAFCLDDGTQTQGNALTHTIPVNQNSPPSRRAVFYISLGSMYENETKIAGKESGPRLFRRAGYIRDRAVAEGELRL